MSFVSSSELNARTITTKVLVNLKRIKSTYRTTIAAQWLMKNVGKVTVYVFADSKPLSGRPPPGFPLPPGMVKPHEAVQVSHPLLSPDVLSSIH